MATIKIKHIRAAEIVFENVDLSITVLKLKEMIQDKSGAAKETQRLILKGSMMTDSKTLAECNVESGAVIFLATPKVTAAPPPAAVVNTPVAPAPVRNLFGGPTPNANGGGGGQLPEFNEAMLAQLPPHEREAVQQLLNTPQGRDLIRQLREDPALLQRMLAGGMPPAFGGGGPPQRPDPIPRDIFNVAIEVMNGAPIPEGFPTLDSMRHPGAHPPSASPTRTPLPTNATTNATNATTPQGARQEYVSRAQINAALEQALGTKPPTSGAGPATTTPSFVVEVKTAASFETMLKNAGDKLVVVDFFAPWCGPCKTISPQFDRFSTIYKDVVFLRVNGDECGALKTAYSVNAYPTFVFIRSKTEIHRFAGADPSKLETAIKAHQKATPPTATTETPAANPTPTPTPTPAPTTTDTVVTEAPTTEMTEATADTEDTEMEDDDASSTAATTASEPPQQYAEQLAQLQSMGFVDDVANVQALNMAGGDVMTAVTFLV